MQSHPMRWSRGVLSLLPILVCSMIKVQQSFSFHTVSCRFHVSRDSTRRFASFSPGNNPRKRGTEDQLSSAESVVRSASPHLLAPARRRRAPPDPGQCLRLTPACMHALRIHYLPVCIAATMEPKSLSISSPTDARTLEATRENVDLLIDTRWKQLQYHRKIDSNYHATCNMSTVQYFPD